MKKLIVLATIILFTLSFAFVVYAEDAPSDTAAVAKGDTKITLGGTLRFRGMFEHNMSDQLNDGTKRGTPAAGGYDDHISYYDTLVKLNVDAKVSDSVEGFVELQTQGNGISDAYTWGQGYKNGQTASVTPGTGSATGIYPAGNTTGPTMMIKQAWIQYTKDMYGLKVGHQLLKLGNSIFFDHTKFGDDAILVFANPVKNLTIAALTAKFVERNTPKNDDGDDYTVLAVYNGGTYHVSGDVSLVNDQGFKAFVPSYSNAHVWNLALRGDATFENFTIRPDIEVQAGKFAGLGTTPDATVKGWAWMLGLDYKLAPAVLTLEGASGTGSKAGSKDFNMYITSLGNDQHYTYVYEYKMKSAAGAQSTGLADTTYIKGGASADFTKELSGNMYLYWLQATEKVALNGGKLSRDLGWELDAKINYKFAKNLQYWVDGGYMWVGDAYAYPGSIGKNDAYGIRNGIQLDF